MLIWSLTGGKDGAGVGSKDWGGGGTYLGEASPFTSTKPPVVKQASKKSEFFRVAKLPVHSCS